jgi:sugar phosphate isomerase/epimerase
MRLGGPLFDKVTDPDSWTAALKKCGYSAAYCPLKSDADDATVRAYADAAAKANIVIAEVGAWSNTSATDDAKRREAIAFCQKQLALAERIGARCCVNIAGSRGATWHGPDPRDVTEGAFDQLVQTTREIIDAVKPTRSFFSLEMMAWAFPYDAKTYHRLIIAIDRKAFAVHLDPVNIISSPLVYFHTGDVIRELFSVLGPQIRSCHAKDIKLSDKLTVHLDEVRPGLGALDYAAYLRELDRLEPDTTLMLEHLSKAEEYDAAAQHIRNVAGEVGVKIRV